MSRTRLHLSILLSLIIVQISTAEVLENEFSEVLNNTLETGEIKHENEVQKEETSTEDVVIEPPVAANIQEGSEFTPIDNILLPSYLLVSDSPPAAEASSENVTSDQGNSTQKYVQCIPKMGSSEVEVLNGTSLIKLLMPDTNVTNKDATGTCVVILFYATYCPFSSMAAPHFNALPRAFPDVKMVAIDAMKYHFFNAQNGIGGVPTLFLFHNGRPVSKFNESDYTLELFSKFVTKHTGIKPEEKSYVTSADFSGPVSSVSEKDTDYYLGLSWAFILLCSVYYFSKSKWWEWIVETVQITWRESEAQHEHTE